jgi:hypothetical protein
MLRTFIPTGFFVAALVASLHVAAAPRFWTLAGVELADGAVASGYFSYDDATNTIANWNLRFAAGAGSFTPHTYVPGNSSADAIAPAMGVPPYIIFRSLEVDPRFEGSFINTTRAVWIATLGPLDGNSATVPIDVSINLSVSGEYFEDHDLLTVESRDMTAGSLALTSTPPPVTIVQVDEFHHQGLGRYFITADAAEKHVLDTGVHPGWERTGESFKAYAIGSSASGSINPVCRFYGDPVRGLHSHFHSADSGECVQVLAAFPSQWLLESDNAFQVNLPDKTTGACPSGTVPVYRLWNERGNSNHRYTASATIKAGMLAAGHVAEGYGPDSVAMCAVQ